MNTANSNKNAGTIKVLFLVSGILNLLTFISWILITVLATVSFPPLGCLSALVTLVSAASCTYDFISYNRLNKLNRTGTYRTLKIAAVIDICVIFSLNITSVVFGIIILNILGRPETIQELKEKGVY